MRKILKDIKEATSTQDIWEAIKKMDDIKLANRLLLATNVLEQEGHTLDSIKKHLKDNIV